MGESSDGAREISLGENFGPVVVSVNGARIEVGADGSVQAHPAANGDTAAKSKTALEIGDEMADGTTYAGISPDTHKPMYARPKDEPGIYSFNAAANHAKYIGGGFRVPSEGELNVLWKNRNKGKLKGTFNETGSCPAGWYWSSTPFTDYLARAQRFSDGFQFVHYRRLVDSSLRLVR